MSDVMLDKDRFGLSAFALKMIAIVFMTIDHFTELWYWDIGEPLALILRSSGRFTFPIMVFLLAEGYHYTSNKYKYAGRMLIFAFISMGPFYMMSGRPWNVLFTLFAGLVLLIIKDECADMFKNVDSKIWTTVFGVLAFVLSVGLYQCDWGFLGIFAIYVGGQIKDTKIRALAVPLVLLCGYVLSNWVEEGGFPPALAYYPISSHSWAFYGGLFVIPFILLLYNGKKGYSNGIYTKYLFYVYYPLHIFVLAFIRSLV